MTEHTPATVTSMEDASNARWLAKTLAPARAHMAGVPSAEVIDRIRERVMGESAPRKRTRIAA